MIPCDAVENGVSAARAESCGCAEAQRAEEPVRVRIPAVDIVEGEGEVILTADFPGVEAAGVDITLEKNVLAIRGKPAVKDRGESRLLYAECGGGEFRRSFILSDDINRDGISAGIKDGVLTIRLAKSVPVSRKITLADS